jgi:hypothetical protein
MQPPTQSRLLIPVLVYLGLASKNESVMILGSSEIPVPIGLNARLGILNIPGCFDPLKDYESIL